MDSDAANVDALLLVLFLMHEWKRLEAENKELRALLHAEYESYARGKNRLYAFRHPISDN